MARSSASALSGRSVVKVVVVRGPVGAAGSVGADGEAGGGGAGSEAQAAVPRAQTSSRAAESAVRRGCFVVVGPAVGGMGADRFRGRGGGAGKGIPHPTVRRRNGRRPPPGKGLFGAADCQ
ncbi:hypothetical protein Kpho02_08780 [Kitasatospora phosalacinea]|uniref:Uncharacterized protein n=1 Tax=Kitasatospora phosalacinea TaxID=2065 RepID=A0A9W6Q273_9ACTN|nr:hypothetical protein Kpho02_08780 [Kitasatospora phosalacinea]